MSPNEAPRRGEKKYPLIIAASRQLGVSRATLFRALEGTWPNRRLVRRYLKFVIGYVRALGQVRPTSVRITLPAAGVSHPASAFEAHSGAAEQSNSPASGAIAGNTASSKSASGRSTGNTVSAASSSSGVHTKQPAQVEEPKQ